MKIAFFSESGFSGKISRDFENMRTEYAWYVGLDATHHPIVDLPSMEKDKYDLGIIIIPKMNIEMFMKVDLIEHTGQSVVTIRSLEYQLESYIYQNDGKDRFHDLDWNFDEAIIHNTEQVSGLLRLDLTPKNDVPLITEYPIIGINDITILYSKEEQKYRFNQFWDITRERGEFNPNVNQSIFITELNGYIRDLNQANLNYFKPAFERKKFRHYWNKVILRRSNSENRKMILKLTNTKINASFR